MPGYPLLCAGLCSIARGRGAGAAGAASAAGAPRFRLAPRAMLSTLPGCARRPLARSLVSRASAEPEAQPDQGTPLPPLAKPGAASMLHYFVDVQRRYPDAVIMAQVGSFMEMYFEQAAELGPLLKLKVARKQQRNPLTGEPFVHMAGFPLARKEFYEVELVKGLNRTVVTLMQDSRFITSGGSEEEKRPVARILTPGTLLEENFVDQQVNNYLAAVSTYQRRRCCMMWVDVASGKVSYEIMNKEDLGNALARVAPREVIVDRNSERDFVSQSVDEYAPGARKSFYKFPPVDLWTTRVSPAERNTFLELDAAVQRAFVALLSYVKQCMPGAHIELSSPERLEKSAVMQIDSRARAALEISSSASSSAKGSLMSTIRRTRTLSGSRLLQDWLASPLQDPAQIEDRQDKLQFFLDQSRVPILQLGALLAEMPDGHRTLQKLSVTRLYPKDLLTFASSVVTIQAISELLLKLEGLPSAWKEQFESLVEAPAETADEILRSIDQSALSEGEAAESNHDLQTVGGREDGAADTSSVADGAVESSRPNPMPSSQTPRASKGSRKSRARSLTASAVAASIQEASGVDQAIKRDYTTVLYPGVSRELEYCYGKLSDFLKQEKELAEQLQEQYGGSLSLRWSPSLQFHAHIILNGKNAPQNHEQQGHRLLNTKNKNAYLSIPEWTALGNFRLQLNERLRKEEERILNAFRSKILEEHLSSMRRLYIFIDEIDVILSFAALAVEKRLVRPVISEDPGVFRIQEGRHITVEAGIALNGLKSNGFVANNCDLSLPQHVCMVTGPNMGGKSTYLRQNAIIALLAHVGSYVPAESAEIGIIDRIFCRIGAGDDIYGGRSTFMMEMLELSTILNEATERSLAIIDEVGRGTSSKDGLAIAFASLKHLASRTACRTLFATHYGNEIWEAFSQENAAASKSCCTSNDAAAYGTRTTEQISLLMASMRRDSRGQPVFDYKLQPGITSTSCGLLIAEMAGLPAVALADAKQFIATA